MTKNTRHDDEQPGVEPAFEEFTEEDGFIDPSYLSKVNGFLEKAKIDISETVCYLYKYDNYNSGEQKSVLYKYTDGDIPDEDEVGKRWGSGRYVLVLSIPPANGRKPLMRAYKFRINPYYDTLRSGPLPAMPIQQQHDSGKNSMAEAFSMLQGLLATLLPMFQRPPENPDFSKMMAGNYGMFQDIMKRQMLDNVQLMTDYQRNVQLLKDGGGDMNGVEEEPAESIIEKIAPFLNEWLPKLIGGGTESKVVSTVVKGSAMFKEIAKNQAMVKALIAYLDKSQGVAQTNQVLASLGMKRTKK